MTIEERNKAIMKRWEEIINTRNVDRVDDILAEHYTAYPGAYSREDHKHILLTELEGFTCTTDAMIAEKDTVATRMTWRKDGQEPRTALMFARLNDGKVVETWYLIEPEQSA